MIPERNKALHGADNLDFKQVNIAKDVLPHGDIAFVRQVLQHLSNKDVKSFVDRVNQSKPYDHLLVTEHLSSSPDVVANLDKPAGPGIRDRLGSESS